MKKVLVVQPLLPTAIRLLEDRSDIDWEVVTDCSPGNLTKKMEGASGITVRDTPLPVESLRAAPDLKVVSRHGVGYDNVPVDYCSSRGIAVAIAGEANSVSVAEHALYLMLAAARAGIVVDSEMRKGNFGIRSEVIGLELKGRTLLVVGCGRIGRNLIKRAQAFGLRTIIFDPYVKDSPPGAEIVPSLDIGLSQADVVSLHIPLTPATKNILGPREIDLLPDGAIVVNTGRGGLLDEEALLNGIQSGKLHGAGLDTFEHEPLPKDSPLLIEQKIVLSPHSAALTDRSLDAMGKISVQNALDGIDGCLNPDFVVNWSEISDVHGGNQI